MRSRKAWVRMMPLMIVVILAVFGTVPVTAGDNDSTTDDSEVVLYYFHGERRCNTCRTIESYAQTAIETKFKSQLEAGTLLWKVVNTDDEANAHFVKDFQLVSSSLVVAEMNGNDVRRHEVLQDAWTLVRDEPKFIQYVQRSVHEYLK